MTINTALIILLTCSCIPHKSPSDGNSIQLKLELTTGHFQDLHPNKLYNCTSLYMYTRHVMFPGGTCIWEHLFVIHNIMYEDCAHVALHVCYLCTIAPAYTCIQDMSCSLVVHVYGNIYLLYIICMKIVHM